jgi:hypothetical protein
MPLCPSRLLAAVAQPCAPWVSKTCVLLGLVCMGTLAMAADEASPEVRLHAAFARLAPELRASPFGRPLVLQSREGPESIEGEVYGIAPFSMVQLSAALVTPEHWCDVLILHLNTKFCQVLNTAPEQTLVVHIGKKTPQALGETTRLNFNFHQGAANPGFLNIVLTAPEGPFGTTHYRVVMEAIPAADGSALVHLTYAYDFNTLSKLALGVYMRTLGRDKVGFSRVKGPDGEEPQYIQGLRGIAERNTMRYFLAVLAYVESAHGPEAARLDARLHSWFSATEAYPLQLREIELKDYLSMKHDEVLRQQQLPAH